MSEPVFKTKEIRIVFPDVEISPLQLKAMKDLIKRLYAVEAEWEMELGHDAAVFLNGPVRFEVHTVEASVHQTGKPLVFSDETPQI
ncbi:hypothetical protein [Streptomyces sp. NPDC006477]|uniref:hypothetical protein n=1 Tax=Streptomyces sp. NPDC006477 TaxID=3364747 RepID=UPI0036AD36C5